MLSGELDIFAFLCWAIGWTLVGCQFGWRVGLGGALVSLYHDARMTAEIKNAKS